jgi:peptidoglycan/LPS O-acetylase OafA/YrhL
MRNLQEYGLWLVLVTINAVIVSQWVNYLIIISSEAAGLAAGLFLSIFLASLMFLLIRRVISRLDRRRNEGKLQATKALKAVAVI